MKRAFTLVELLVVIGVITVLVTMLVPSVNKAFAYARRTACTKNQQAVSAGLIAYRDDHGDQFPSWSRRDAANNRTYYDSSLSISMLYPEYVEQLEAMICPSSRMSRDELALSAEDEDGNPFDLDADGEDDVRIDYTGAMSATFIYRVSNDPSYVIDPGIPRNAWTGRPIYGDGADECIGWTCGGMAPTDVVNHGDVTLVLFLDGHVGLIEVSNDDQLFNDPSLTDAQVAGVDDNDDPLRADYLRESGVAFGLSVYRDNALLGWNGSAWIRDGDEEADCHLGTHINFDDATTPDLPRVSGVNYLGPDGTNDFGIQFDIDDVDD